MLQERFDSEIVRLVPRADLDGEFLLGVSGGIDSMCMANLFLNSSLGLKFSVAHVNFSLRPGSCDRDENFVKEWAEAHGVRFFSVKYDTLAYAKERYISSQMAARDLRYNWFNSLVEEYGFVHLAIAHNLNDSVETFFLNLLRGTGLRGLSGIKVQNGSIIRPLMKFTRKEIEDYMSSNGFQNIEDESNSESHYQRNRIRNEVFPHFGMINPSFLDTLEKEMERFADVADIMNNLFEQKKSDFIRSEDGVMQVDIPALLSEAHREYWLFCIFDGYGFNDTQIKQISESLESQSGKVFISQTHKVIRDRKTLKIYPLDEPSARRRISITVVPRPTDFLVKKRDESVQYLDADKVKMPLHCRKWQPADKFKPLGMKGFKKLSDFFTDLKLDLEQKKRQVVVTTVDKKGNEQIVCILGTRIDDRYKVTAKTKNLVRIAVKSKATS